MPPFACPITLRGSIVFLFSASVPFCACQCTCGPVVHRPELPLRPITSPAFTDPLGATVCMCIKNCLNCPVTSLAILPPPSFQKLDKRPPVVAVIGVPIGVPKSIP